MSPTLTTAQAEPAPADATPAMAEAPLSSLATAELLLLSMWRLHGAAGAGCAQAGRWQTGLVAAGLGAEPRRACASLFSLLAAGVPGQTRRPPRCPWLGADESRLLLLIGLLQHGQAQAARALLDNWLPPALARLVAPPAATLAMALAGRHLAVPPRLACPPPSLAGAQAPARLH